MRLWKQALFFQYLLFIFQASQDKQFLIRQIRDMVKSAPKGTAGQLYNDSLKDKWLEHSCDDLFYLTLMENCLHHMCMNSMKFFTILFGIP